jgi:hypothetical protein
VKPAFFCKYSKARSGTAQIKMPATFPDGGPDALINFVKESFTSILRIKCIKYLNKPLFHNSPFVNNFSSRKSETNSHLIFLNATHPLYLRDGILVDQVSTGCAADRRQNQFRLN